ncbi:MAG: hypothetical protein ACOYKE_02510 [Ferruginibacter sp.]
MAAVVHDMNYSNTVAVLNGAAEVLVTHRELRSRYCTNRSIKTWATYFLLKSVTTSGVIRDWTKQKNKLLAYCKLTENVFRARLAEMVELKLVELSKNRSLLLTSFETAADILGIEYTGTIKIQYNDTLPGKQIFQYFLRAEEFRANQHKQLAALTYYASKNPLLKNQLLQLLDKHGFELKRLENDSVYFQKSLLSLQQHAFKEGSPLLSIIHQLRADINRSVTGIKKSHGYKSAQSASYLKNVMRKMQLISIEKICIESNERSRLYIAGEERPREAYKWLPSKKRTAWFLTDQIAFKFHTELPKIQKNEKKKIA